MPKINTILLNVTLPVFSFFFLFFSHSIYSQDTTKQDSLRQDLSNKSGTAYVEQLIEIAFLEKNKPQQIALFKEVIKKATSISYLKALAVVNHELALLHENKAELETAIQFFDKGIKQAKEVGDLNLELKIVGDKSNRLNFAGRTTEAFKLLMENLQRAEENGGKPEIIAQQHFELGNFHRLQHDVDKAIFHLEKSLAFYKKSDNLDQQAKVIYTIGNTYKVGMTDEYSLKGISYMEKLLEPPYFESLPDRFLPRVQTSIGGMLVWLEEYEKGEKILLEALEIKKANKDTVSMMFSYNELATLYTVWNQPEKSIFYGEEILAIMEKKDNIFALSDSYQNLAKAYASVNKYEQAYKYFKRVEGLRDSVMTQEKAIALAEMETKFKTDIQEEKIAHQAAMMSQQKSRAYFIGGVVMFCGLMLFLWLQARMKLKAKETKQLAALNESKSRFFTNISHELRTPLTLLINPLRQLQVHAESNGETVKIPSLELNRMVRNGERLERLIKQMTELSKLDEGKIKLQTAEQDLVEFTKSLVQSFDQTALDNQVELNFFSTEKSLLVYFDTDKMESILLNLLYNAFKFTLPKDEIKVLLTLENGKVNLQIQDTGVGIEAHQLPNIFDRFYQVNDRDNRQQGGIGIGLSLVKDMVQLHHGSIEVESVFGEKTIFNLSFPLGKNHLSENEIMTKTDWKPQRIQVLGNQRIKNEETLIEKNEDARPLILVVEDNIDLLDYLKEQLNSTYRVLIASRGKEGFEMAMEYLPELIISDVMMPKMNGFEFCEAIKKESLTSHIPVVLLTAKTDKANIQLGLELGADDYMTKPFDQVLLLTKINNLIEQRRKLRILFSEKIIVKPSELKVVSKEDQFVVELVEVIEKNMPDANFGIDQLSRVIGISRSQLYRKINALTGQTPTVFLRTIRLERAKQLLEQDAGNASEIAYMVGFKNANYFFKCFKDHFGKTPKEHLSQITHIPQK